MLTAAPLALLIAGCGSADPLPAPTVTATVTVTASPSQSVVAQPSAVATTGGETPAESGVVEKVTDGDTIDVAGVGTIRMQGIDTPEVGECGYESASRELAKIVNGKTVDLVIAEPSDSVDKYGRLLRYVDVAGVDAGLQLIKQGLAVAKYDSRDGYGFHPREESYIAADEATAPAGGC